MVLLLAVWLFHRKPRLAYGCVVVAIVASLVLSLMGVHISGLQLMISSAVVLLMAGMILYDTSNIMRRYPTNAHVSAAMELFVDVIMLFKFLLLILMNRD